MADSQATMRSPGSLSLTSGTCFGGFLDVQFHGLGLAALSANIIADLKLALGGSDVRTRDVLLCPTSRHPVFDDVCCVLLDLDLYLHKPCGVQHVSHLSISRGPRNSAAVTLGRFQLLGYVTHSEDIRNRNASSGLQHPVHLTIDLRLVGRKVNDTIGDETVHNTIAHRQMLDLAKAERHILQPLFLGILSGLAQHLWRHVHSNHMP
mmetsp:Transcript_54173/g.66425  ORF Transcript_54173/g.66425 Transcript_54173/m.66425 type:complete len:207 (-) Transcript_54173:62-682(-)